MPKVSIIIPAYNSALFIKRALDSVLGQTWGDWELLVIDDCSTDGTADIVASYAQKDARIRLLHTEKNSGAPALPKNIGVENARGEYVAFLDHDDEWLPTKLEKQLQVFADSKDERLGLVSCGANLINNKGKRFSVYNPALTKVGFPEILLRNPVYSNSSVLMKKEVIENVGERDVKMKYSEDWDMWIRVCENNYNMYFIDEPLFNYYFHDSNVTKATKDRLIKVRDAEYVFCKHQDLYAKYNYTHVGYFRLGVMYFLGGDAKKSRECFSRSFRLKNLFIPAYVGYVLSFFGALGVLKINLFIFLYRLMHGRTYLIKSEGF